MIIWKYTDQSRSVVVSDDGCRSCLVTALPTGTEIFPPDPVVKQPEPIDEIKLLKDRIAKLEADVSTITKVKP